MNKNQKSIIFLGFIFVMVIGMAVLYVNFLNDRSKIQAQEQGNLSPEQMINGVKSFIDTTTSTIKQVPLKP